MDNSGKRTALNVMLIAGGFGLLAVSCSDSDDETERTSHDQPAPAAEHAPAAATAAPAAPTVTPVITHADAEQTHTAPTTHTSHAAHWDYTGAGAPEHWGGLQPEYSTCTEGREQSPIDISTVTITSLPTIEFNYQPSPLEIVNNGHTIQVNYAPGSYITVGDKRYDLLQFHFHSPSEHTIGGKIFDLGAHFVHKAEDGQLAVIGIVFKDGGANNALSKVWLNMPDKAGTTIKSQDIMVNAADFLPRDFTYFNYNGSLTTPPCTEGVNWMVMATPNTVSAQQVKAYTGLFPHSARPVQPLNGRVVRASN